MLMPCPDYPTELMGKVLVVRVKVKVLVVRVKVRLVLMVGAKVLVVRVRVLVERERMDTVEGWLWDYSRK